MFNFWCMQSIICLFCLTITQGQNVFIIVIAVKILFLLLLLKTSLEKKCEKYPFIFYMCHTFSSFDSFSHLVSKENMCWEKFSINILQERRKPNEIR